MERNILSWNITNWITILLMVFIGYALIAAVVSAGRQFFGGSVSDSSEAAAGTSMAA